MSERPPHADEVAPALAEALSLAARLLRAALLLLAPLYLVSGLHILRPQEQAVVLLFGRAESAGAERVWGPGVHWTLPRPFAEVIRLETGRVKTIDSGTYGPAERDAALPPVETGDEWKRLLLTGDANLLRARWAMRYTIDDAAAHAFGFANPAVMVSNEFRRAVLHATTAFTADRALRTDVDGLRAAIEDTARARFAAIRGGIRVERVEAVALAPPPSVAASFDAVVQAEQERSTRISEAREYAARRANEALGEAASRLSQAASWRDRLVAGTRADAAYFERILPHYLRRPDVVGAVLLQDGIRRALDKVSEKYVIRRGAEGRQELRLWLGPEPKRPGAHADVP
jgi:membrane protease subunit HflK